ncbi:MAG: RHS repeat-associated core domain-containing protein [Thermogutta sp.]|uniref:RHS repeat domain-containing protein n=1 Tax=Thermogutta sp. TaxID=1962930 RepID=UPI0019848379|nr:RHS repeat-associated core domain-containing protein [Thermogutta sp.]MBC7352949.1 RHS repeat-associated core domain-containing protein [Thermogutta sp.]
MDFHRANSGKMQVGHLRQRYLWGPAVDQILAEEAVGGGTADLVHWTLTDHLNTVRGIAKYDSGSDMTTVVNHLIYDAFGKVTSESNPTIDSLFLFTGRPFDSDTQLQNNLNRWYDSRVGRWLSEDPVGFDGGDRNLYRYVGNWVLTAVDPDGLRFVGPTCAPCLQPYLRCIKRAGLMKAGCYAAASGWPLAGDVTCSALCAWLRWSGPGYWVCFGACQVGSLASIGLKWTVCDTQYQDDMMRCGNEYNRCAYYADPRECGCGPGNENWRPD